MSDQVAVKPDRKEYWRNYQRARHAKKKAEGVFVKGARPSIKAKYKEMVKELGLEGQRNWRARQNLKKEICQDQDIDGYIRFMHKRAKRQALSRGIEFKISLRHIPVTEYCPILGVWLEYEKLGVANAPHKPSLDRIDNTRGYIPGNVQVVSARANILKRDAALDELLKMGEWAASQIKKFAGEVP